jgi:hypothetical protein
MNRLRFSDRCDALAFANIAAGQPRLSPDLRAWPITRPATPAGGLLRGCLYPRLSTNSCTVVGLNVTA